jgi:hypothetical protein
MSELSRLLLSPEYRREGYSIDEIQESNDRILILRHRGREIARVSETGLILINTVKIITQEIGQN